MDVSTSQSPADKSNDESFSSGDDQSADLNPCNWSFETVSASELQLPPQSPMKDPFNGQGDYCPDCNTWDMNKQDWLLYRPDSKIPCFKKKCTTCIDNYIAKGLHTHMSICTCVATPISI
jgi:hypothetical protein